MARRCFFIDRKRTDGICPYLEVVGDEGIRPAHLYMQTGILDKSGCMPKRRMLALARAILKACGEKA